MLLFSFYTLLPPTLKECEFHQNMISVFVQQKQEKSYFITMIKGFEEEIYFCLFDLVYPNEGLLADRLMVASKY